MPVEISVVIPLLNEDQTVFELYTRLKSVLNELKFSHELIFVDDGSNDNTMAVVEKMAREDSSVKYLSFSRNFGHQLALYAGIEKSTGDRIILIDGDLQDPPEVIIAMNLKMKEGYDLVYAKRASRKGESFLKKFTARLFYRMLRRITATDIPVDTGDFRIMTRQVVNELLKMNDHSKFLRGQIAWLGFKESHILYHRDERKNGSSNFSYGKMLKFAFDGITGFSNFPLKVASVSGLLVSLVAFILIVYVLIAKLVWGATISGWASIMVTVLFLGGIQLLSVGIIGEYISRINSSVQNRQLYIIRKSNIEES
jgi:glycosyltransferase involved in cell wall biosynthesis